MNNEMRSLTSSLREAHAAFLFDMDGTLLNSIAVVERVWREWAVDNGIEPTAFLQRIHGLRAIEVVRREAVPGLDTVEQAAILLQREMDDVDGIIKIPGIADFLSKIPQGRWAIVTSAPRPLAVLRLAAAGIVPPEIMICGEDVENGKPDPEGYLKAAKLLGVEPTKCVVFEDAPAGISAAERMGANVVVISTTHSHPIETDHLTIDSYDELDIAVTETGALRLDRASVTAR